ncbi:palmitoyltransferase akr1, partial [Ascosphaera pollenicola]
VSLPPPRDSQYLSPAQYPYDYTSQQQQQQQQRQSSPLQHPSRSRHQHSPSAGRSPNLPVAQGGSPQLFATASLDHHIARSHSHHLPSPRRNPPAGCGAPRNFHDGIPIYNDLPPRISSRAAVNEMRMGRSPPQSRLATSPLADPVQAQPQGSQAAEDWRDKGAAVGVRREIDADGKPVSRFVKKGVRDFQFGRTLGEGSYSTVVAASDRQTGKEYAVKILDKRHIIKEKKVKYVNIEKDTLNRLTEHPGVVRLYYTFQDEQSLYFVLDLANNGELLGVLKKMGTFDEECTRFYGAQILDAIDYMHRHDIIHRDLKPENLLLDAQMHVKITDFGTAKILPRQSTSPSTGANAAAPSDPTDPSMSAPDSGDRASSFVGTAEYVSPELLMDKCACKASDLWAFGCIIYQLLAGRPPFKAANEYLTFQKIIALDYEFPPGFPAVARDLVERLLVLNPAQRLPIDQCKSHEFFKGVVWGRSLWKQKAPRLKPYVPPAEVIKLDAPGSGAAPSSVPSTTAPPQSTAPSQKPPRPHPRLITNVAPPSQLDIEWSPVLTHSNERILRMGNLTVVSSPPHHGTSDTEQPIKKFRLFGGTTTRKRQRLVIVTSAGRIVIVPSGGDEKKIKIEISLLAPRVTFRESSDSKGNSMFVIDTKDKHYVFADPDAANSSFDPAEWIDALEKAKEQATFQVASADEPYTPSIPTDGVGAPVGESAHHHGHSHHHQRSVSDSDQISVSATGTSASNHE